jgi:PAS domain S-box-containing protein
VANRQRSAALHSAGSVERGQQEGRDVAHHVRLAQATTTLALVAHALLAATLGATALPLVRTHAPGGHPQFWAVAQDPRGVLYFGNGDGVLEYDGAGWRVFVLPRRGAVRSLASGADGTLYAGSQGDFGYFELAASGERRYVTLLPKVALEDRAFGDVWKTYVTADGVYFQSYSRLFRWASGELRVWRPPSSFHFSFVGDGTLYLLDQEHGLLRLVGDRLEPAPGGSGLAGDRLYAMLPLGAGRFLLGTRRGGLLTYDGAAVRRFPSSAAPHLARHRIYHGAVLPGGRFALGTLTGGVAIVDRQGALLQVLDRSTGLLSDKAAFAFVDRDQALWLAQEGGVSRVEVDSPLSVFPLPEGSDATVISLAQVKERLYVGTSHGLRYLSLASPPIGARLHKIAGIEEAIHDLTVTPDGALAATALGVFHVRGEQAAAVALGSTSFVLIASQLRPGRYYVGQIDGVRTLEQEGSGWRDLGMVPGLSADVRALYERADGGLWVGTKVDGLYRVDASPGASPLAMRAHPSRGLPAGSIDVRRFRGLPVFLSPLGIHVYDERHRRFPLASWSAAVLGDRLASYVTTDRLDRTWIFMGPGPGLSRSAERIAVFQGDPPRPFRLSPVTERLAGWSAITELTDQAGIAWLGTREGLVRLDASIALPPRPKRFAPLCKLHTQSAAAGGDASPESQRGVSEPRLGARSAQVECALPSYFLPESNEFRFWIEGQDTGWSDWLRGGSRLYASLPYGRLRLRAQGRDAYGRESDVVEMPFQIVAPWYRTPPAYLAGLLLTSGLLGSGYHLRVAGMKRRRQQLEEIVRQRTGELFESERNYRDLVENASDVIFALDAEGRLTSLNPAIEELGFPRAELMGRPLAELVEHDDRPKIARWYLAGGEVAPSPVEITLSHGGTVRTVEVKARPIGDRAVVRVEGVARDVSERRAHLDAVLARARLHALQSQLQPHFLFNSLNGIAGQIGRDDEQARRMLAELGELLRLTLVESESQEVPLWQELAVLTKYVALQKSRFGDRLRVQVDAPAHAGDLAVPRFLLQLLVENSIKHGVERLRRQVEVTVIVRREDGCLRLVVADDGPGFASSSRQGVGLANLRERLHTLYGGDQRLELRSSARGGAEVEVVLPARPVAQRDPQGPPPP